MCPTGIPLCSGWRRLTAILLREIGKPLHELRFGLWIIEVDMLLGALGLRGRLVAASPKKRDYRQDDTPDSRIGDVVACFGIDVAEALCLIPFPSERHILGALYDKAGVGLK